MTRRRDPNPNSEQALIRRLPSSQSQMSAMVHTCCRWNEVFFQFSASDIHLICFSLPGKSVTAYFTDD